MRLARFLFFRSAYYCPLAARGGDRHAKQMHLSLAAAGVVVRLLARRPGSR